MSKSKNNFTDQKVLEKVEYHCWVLYSPGAKWGNYSMPRKKTYNGFISKKDKGLQGLKSLVEERSSIIEQAQLYNTQSDRKIADWNSKNKNWE